MKTNKLIIVIFSLVLITLAGCGKDTYLGLEAQDAIAPGVPTVTKVVPKHGGAVIYFDAPLDLDLLNVVANYEINGISLSSVASAYVDSIYVGGFGHDAEYKVFLTSVDKSKNESAPVEVAINPLEPPVELIYETLNVIPSFGGIRVTWDNNTEANVVINVSVKDEIGDWISLESFFTNSQEGLGVVRGMDSIPYAFQINIRDKWKNYSENFEFEEKPFHEVELKKSLFEQVIPLPGDAPDSGYPLRNLWDNSHSSFWHGSQGDVGEKFITFDLGQVAKISRFKMWQRDDGSFYEHNNLMHYIVYGAIEITDEMRKSGSLEGWIELKDAWCYRPSGLVFPEDPTDEDNAYAKAGDDQEVDLDAPPVRYIRILPMETWSGAVTPNVAEIAFWGEPQK